MNRIVGIVLVAFGLVALGPAALAGNCKAVDAEFVDVCTGGPSCSGTITNGGKLNGTTVTVFTGGPTATPSPTTVSLALDITITTNQGQLKSSYVNLFDGPLGATAALGTINPAASTGRFAGATGLLFITGRVTNFSPFTITLKLTGEICTVKE